MRRYRVGAHTKTDLKVHLVWVPKYRKKALTGEVAIRVRDILRQIANYHLISRRVIQFCIQHGCGTLHLEDLDELRREDLKSEFKRLMWVPHKLRDFITYKAHEAGIKVVIVNPLNSSLRCSACGHISENNRRKRDKWCVFVCEVCGKHDQDGNRKRPVNADYNAAKNIALATGDIITEGYKIPGEGEADSPSPGRIRNRKRQKPMTAVSAAGSTAGG